MLTYMHISCAMEIAVTVDDLPTSGDLPAHITRMALAKKMIAVFEKHHISGVYGLINGVNSQESQEGMDILKTWVEAGHFLGNHTFHHIDLAKTDSNDYITDIKKNEPLLSNLMRDKNYRYFRYPFLSEGNTQERRDHIRQFLFNHDYQIAPVTVDFFEYEWIDPYIRCLKKHDEQSIAWLKQSFIEQANNALIIAHELSTMLFNREIKHVLLIHINAFTVERLDELLTGYEKQQVKFISLSDALTDEAYQINPNIVRERAYTFLNQVRLARGLNNPDSVKELYDTLPEEKLKNLCQ